MSAAEAAGPPPDQGGIPGRDLLVVISCFATALPRGPAYGTTERLTWGAFTAHLKQRREGEKDGPCFVPARFQSEANGRVRRLKGNVLARTAVALDCETNKSTGEVPPAVAEVVARIERQGWKGAVYTSHNHRQSAPRYRVVLPLSTEIPPHLPAVEAVADLLGLSGVLDTGKTGPASVFYLPSTEVGAAAHHETVIIDGDGPIFGAWLCARSAMILVGYERERARHRAEAAEAAARRREARTRNGSESDTSLIEAIRERLDLHAELVNHGYEPAGGDRYLFPGSETGVAGVYVLAGRDGVDRVFSHHSGDPLAAGNLPSWCRVKALDAVDVVTILDHGGNLKAALHSLAKRYGIETARPMAIPTPKAETAPAEEGFLQETEGGAPIPNLANALTMLRTDPAVQGLLAFNEMDAAAVLLRQVPRYGAPVRIAADRNSAPRRLQDEDVAALQEYLQRAGLKRLGIQTVHDAAARHAREKSFHPVRDYLGTLTWDGKPSPPSHSKRGV